MSLIPKSVTPKQASDAGMALVLILLIAGLLTGATIFYRIAVAALVINMIFPAVYTPFARVWFGFAHLIGSITSRVILVLVFCLVVLPVGLFRRALGKDPLRLKDFRKSAGSVMKVRNHLFIREDMEHPY